MPRRLQLERAVGRKRGLHAADGFREARPRLENVELGRHFNRVRQIGGSHAKRVRQREQDAADFLRFLLLERDDVVVDLDGAERLEVEAGAARRRAVHDARNRRPVLGLHDDHIAAIALGDDLILQVLRRVLAAQVRLKRAAQTRALLAESIANDSELGARVVDDIAGVIDLLPHLLGFAFERRRGAARGFETRERSGGAANRRDGFVDRAQECREVEQSLGFERAAFDRERHENLRHVAGGAQRKQGVRREIFGRLGGRREQLRDLVRVNRRREAAEPLVAHRRQREAADHVDDTIELESPEDCRLHGGWKRQS